MKYISKNHLRVQNPSRSWFPTEKKEKNKTLVAVVKWINPKKKKPLKNFPRIQISWRTGHLQKKKNIISNFFIKKNFFFKASKSWPKNWWWGIQNRQKKKRLDSSKQNNIKKTKSFEMKRSKLTDPFQDADILQSTVLQKKDHWG